MNTAVLLCSRAHNADPSARADVEIIDDLCRYPERIGPAVEDADRVVLGVCGGEYSLGAIQAAVRHAGIDPLGMELIDVTSTNVDDDSFDLVLAARVARAEAFAGSSPVNAKISFPHMVNRRQLLRGPAHEYHAAPSVDQDLCSAASGCRACVEICPQKAISMRSGQIHHDRSVCEPCGLCVTVCPTGATVNPATTPSQLEAEITALLDPAIGAAGARAIAFVCSRGKTLDMTAGWHAVTVPCTGMVPPGWLLAPLLMGAGAVASLPCSDSDCGLVHDARTVGAVEFCRLFLREVGESHERVSPRPTGDPPEPLPRIALSDPFGPHGSVEVMQALASGHHEPRSVVVKHASAPTGIVQLYDDVCTGCTTCAQTCPTGALAFAESRQHTTISFDAARCTACAQCVHACPELHRGAISLESVAHLDALSSGRTTVIDMDMVLCESCGGPIAPAPMMDRITSMLGPEQEPIRALITSRCIACRNDRRWSGSR